MVIGIFGIIASEAKLNMELKNIFGTGFSRLAEFPAINLQTKFQKLKTFW
jgi:hypothetical protein